jgi:hypothetical protein
MSIWFSLCLFGIVFPIWYVWTKKNGNPANEVSCFIFFAVEQQHDSIIVIVPRYDARTPISVLSLDLLIVQNSPLTYHRGPML